MGLFSFIKSTGSKLFEKKELEAPKGEAKNCKLLPY